MFSLRQKLLVGFGGLLLIIVLISMKSIVQVTDLGGAIDAILKQNYRSTPQILKACMNLIRHNQRKIEKSFETQNEDGEQVVVLESSNEEGEALNMVSEISDLVQRRGFAHKDIAVLYRCNFQSRVIEEVFSRLKVPFHIENGTNFYHRTEVRV